MGLYQKIDEDNSGEIDIDEFVEFVLSDRCNIMLKEILVGTDDTAIKKVAPPPTTVNVASLPFYSKNCLHRK